MFYKPLVLLMALALLMLARSLTFSLIRGDIELWSPDDQAQGRCSIFIMVVPYQQMKLPCGSCVFLAVYGEWSEV